MKKLILIALTIVLLPYILSNILFNSKKITQSDLLKKIIPIEKKEYSNIKFNEEVLSYAYFSPEKSMQILFDLNLNNKLTSLDIIDKQKCTYLINGGFYDKLDQPIGLVIKDGLEISKNQKNPLFNGYLSASASAEFEISTTKPSLNSIVAIQSGPILIIDYQLQELQLISDQNKRRMALMISDDDTPFFITVFSKDNQIEGPLLKDFPKLLSNISKKEKIKIKDAINLDGGSASTFYSPTTHIKELSSIGSYICFK